MHYNATAFREQVRLEDLYSYAILDTEAERDFDELVELASDIASTPVSLITLIDKDRQWFKANKGFAKTETAREVSFCTQAIAYEKECFIVPDASLDERFAANELVVSYPNIRFYAGFPLITPKGNKLGTLCVIDSKPHTLPAKKIAQLQKLARQAMKLLELHKTHKKLQQLREVEAKQKDALERLLENQRKIVAILAHDTRGPLYAMKQLLNLFADGLVPADQSSKLHQMIGAQTDETINMVESLVKWGEIQLHATIEDDDTTTLNDIIDAVFKQYAPSASSKGITLTNAVGKTPAIKANDKMLGFIVRNLVNNAIKYTEGGEVKISGKTKGDFYTIIVADTGVGMSNQARKTLFLGKTSSSYGTRKESGSGLGLMLINDFVQQVGGSISVRSQLNRGTIISVDLPWV